MAFRARNRRRSVGKLRAPAQPDGIRLSYYASLVGVLDYAKALVDHNLRGPLDQLLAEPHPDAKARTDEAAPARVTRLVSAIGEKVAKKYPNGYYQKLADKAANATSDFQKDQLFGQVKDTLGVSFDAIRTPGLDKRIAQFTAENVGLIKTIAPTYLGEVEKIALDAIRTGRRAESAGNEIDRRYAVGKSQAKLIARDQIGKFTGELNKARQGALGVEKYIWRTVGDERVRPEHEERDGESFSWDEPAGDESDPGDGGIPGEGINCRCYAEPDLSGLLGEDEEGEEPEETPDEEGTGEEEEQPEEGSGQETAPDEDAIVETEPPTEEEAVVTPKEEPRQPPPESDFRTEAEKEFGYSEVPQYSSVNSVEDPGIYALSKADAPAIEGLSELAGQRIQSFEREYVQDDHEFSTAISRDGKQTIMRTTDYQVAQVGAPLSLDRDFDVTGKSPLQDAVFTHNHPNSSPLSQADLVVSLYYDISELRAIGKAGNVRPTGSPKSWNTSPDARAVTNRFIRGPNGWKYSGKIHLGTIERVVSQEYNATSQIIDEKLLKLNAEAQAKLPPGGWYTPEIRRELDNKIMDMQTAERRASLHRLAEKLGGKYEVHEMSENFAKRNGKVAMHPKRSRTES